MQNAQELLDTIALEKIEENIYRGESHSIGSRRVFGGQVLAQSLDAARRTVPHDFIVHSMHGYFILAGDVEKPIVFTVDRIRDGRSFTTRRVVAVQNGQAIFNMAASFQVQQPGLEHQIDMPNVTPPDNLIADQELLRSHQDNLPDIYRRFLQPRPIEFRPVEKPNFMMPEKGQPHRHVWLKAKGNLSDAPFDHQKILAYASDYNLLTTAMRPHGVTFDQLQMASLDHAMWFHREFRIDEWLLYELESPSAANSRGFTNGHVFNQRGELVASVVQEGLMRLRKDL
jgi:acyl-CoA thioesterase-2